MTIRQVLAAIAVVATVGVGLSGVAHGDGGDPVGAFDSLSVRLYSAPLHRSWEFRGWAADPDAAGQPIDVHIYVDGQRVVPSAAGGDSLYTGEPRPDVQAVFPFAGPNSGWSEQLLTDNGPHDVCAYAINVGAGTQNTTLGCLNIPARGTTNLGDPQGHLDEIAVTPGLARVVGWTGDPDPDSTSPPHVQVFEDGRPFLELIAAVDRPDVHAALPGLANATGFDQSLPVLPGLHIFCVDAGNDGSHGTNNTSLGCVVRDVPGATPPADNEVHGAFDGITYPDQQPRAFGYVPYPTGWAWDPTTSGTTRVVIRDLWDAGFGTEPVFAATSTVEGTTGQSRPDVQNVYPSAPPDTGYQIPFPAPATEKYHHERYLCTYAGPPDREHFLGCTSP